MQLSAEALDVGEAALAEVHRESLGREGGMDAGEGEYERVRRERARVDRSRERTESSSHGRAMEFITSLWNLDFFAARRKRLARRRMLSCACLEGMARHELRRATKRESRPLPRP
jgi:hypothetical protein